MGRCLLRDCEKGKRGEIFPKSGVVGVFKKNAEANPGGSKPYGQDLGDWDGKDEPGCTESAKMERKQSIGLCINRSQGTAFKSGNGVIYQ